MLMSVPLFLICATFFLFKNYFSPFFALFLLSFIPFFSFSFYLRALDNCVSDTQGLRIPCHLIAQYSEE